jgi:hypothetical protein
MSDAGDEITSVLIEAIVTNLTADLQTAVAETDPAYVGYIQAGKLQDDPIAKGSTWGHTITVHGGDPDEIGSAWADEWVLPSDKILTAAPMIPTLEIGGTGFSGMLWWRRGVVSIDSFFVLQAYDRSTARRIALDVRRRVEQTLGKNQGRAYIGLKDNYGQEQVLQFFVMKSQAVESGGPKQHIWRNKVWWQALTSRD